MALIPRHLGLAGLLLVPRNKVYKVLPLQQLSLGFIIIVF